MRKPNPIKQVGSWGGSMSVRVQAECRELGIETGDYVKVSIEDGKIVIEKWEEDKK